MSEVVNSLSQKRYNEIRRMVISDALDMVLNTLATQVTIENKDKTFTVKRLTNTIDLLCKSLAELNNDKIPSEIVQSLKPKITSKLSNTFCYKLQTKNENQKDLNSYVPVIFTPNIQLAVEVSYNEVKKDVKLQKSSEHYRFFVFPLSLDNKEYLITYAEENKYSNREIIEIICDNVSVDKDVLPNEIKNKYCFI